VGVVVRGQSRAAVHRARDIRASASTTPTRWPRSPTIPMPPAYAGAVALAVTGAGDLVAAGDMAHGNAAAIVVHPADGTTSWGSGRRARHDPVRDGAGRDRRRLRVLPPRLPPGTSPRQKGSLSPCPSGDGSVVAGWHTLGGTVSRWRGGSAQVAYSCRHPARGGQPARPAGAHLRGRQAERHLRQQ
jgi:hypothetical protein